MDAVRYLLGRLELPPAPGLMQVRADFGGGPEPEPEPGDGMSEQIQERVEALRAAVRAAQETRPEWGASRATYQEAMRQIMDEQIGPMDDLAREIGELAGSSPVPPPPAQAPLPWSSLHGFTARTHWDGDARAIDVYLLRDGQPAPRGLPIPAPVAGRVRKYVSQGPAGSLITAVLQGRDGLHYAITHVLDGFGEGDVEAGDPWCQLGDSGIEIFDLTPTTIRGLQPWHLHFFVYQYRPTPDGKGDRPALPELQRLGFDLVEIVPRIPSPQDYQAGRARAGRLL